MPKALSSYEGEIDFYLNTRESTLCTVSKEWINDSRFTPNYTWWDEPIKIKCTTLDNMIDDPRWTSGRPAEHAGLKINPSKIFKTTVNKILNSGTLSEKYQNLIV